ncbi:hypothetical protein D3C81_1456750 [compost metagenome]
MPGRALIQHGVVYIHQTVDLMCLQQIDQLQRLINGKGIGLQNLFCLIIIQVSAITANCRCIQRQCLIKRMNSNVMATCDNDKLVAGFSGARERFERRGQ